MANSKMRPLVAGFVAIALLGGGAGLAYSQDKESLVASRHDSMKRIGRDLGAVKSFIEDKVDQAKATEGAADLVAMVQKMPTWFPEGTATTDFPGKSGAKPAIWSDKEKFAASHKLADEKAEALLAAVKTGDKKMVSAAFDEMGKNGCGNCHTAFREKI